MKKLSLFSLFFMTVACIATAQNRAFKIKADKAYAEKDYVTAAYYYEKALQNGTTTTQGTVPYYSTRQKTPKVNAEIGDITYHLAESYRLYQNLVEAGNWYQQAADNYEASYPLARLWYAICLRSDSHIDESISQLKTFINNNKGNKHNLDLGNKELNNSLFAKQQIASPGLSKISKMATGLNADAGDFSMSVNNGRYWFTSSRSAFGNSARFNRIYTADTLSGKPKLELVPDGKSDLQYATPSLDSQGKRLYLTVFSNIKGTLTAAIYISRYLNQQWSAPQKLSNIVNTVGYNTMQPFVTADGKHLYFASNRPGGMGGTDIWVSELDSDGSPINSTNLGGTINTPDDEQAPYYSATDHKLVYSSKGFIGMGGFDLFESEDTIANKWTTPQNLGYPFNSTKDDIYYFPDSKDENTVYISSDRESECCLNLMKVKVNKPKPKPLPPPPPILTAMLSGLVIDCATNKPLPGVNISLVDSASKQAVNFTTGVNGKYQLLLTVKHSYALQLEKPDYFTKVIPISIVKGSLKDTLYNPVICQQHYQVNKPIVINNILYDFNKYVLKPESKIILDGLVAILKDNPEIKVELSAHTDSKGHDWSNKLLSQRRAQSCVTYIISRGISSYRITAKGYGASKPIAPNTLPGGTDNPAGRRLNRRTEFKVLGKAK